jgi:hypothetical protein
VCPTWGEPEDRDQSESTRCLPLMLERDTVFLLFCGAWDGTRASDVPGHTPGQMQSFCEAVSQIKLRLLPSEHHENPQPSTQPGDQGPKRIGGEAPSTLGLKMKEKQLPKSTGPPVPGHERHWHRVALGFEKEGVATLSVEGCLTYLLGGPSGTWVPFFLSRWVSGAQQGAKCR